MKRNRLHYFFILTISLWLLSGTPALAWVPDSLFVGDPATRAIYLIANGEKQLIPDLATLEVMGFSLTDVRWLTGYMIGQIPQGPNFLPLKRGALVTDISTRQRYILDGGKWEIHDQEVLGAWGWPESQERPLPSRLIRAMPSLGGMPSWHASALIHVQDSDSFYLFAQGKRWRVHQEALADLGLQAEDAYPLSSFLALQASDGGDLPILQPGSLLSSSAEGDDRIYLLDKGKRFVPDQATLAAYGWEPEQVLELPAEMLAAIPEGSPLQAVTRGENLFAHSYWGQCTWYVAERRLAPSWRSARYWLRDAQASGFAVGQRPLPGAIMVYDGGQGRGIHGHVAYVEAVHPDGSFTLAEANTCGWACVMTRLANLDDEVGVLGFVYWKVAE